MIPRDKPRFASLLAGLGEVFDREPTPSLAEAYFTALKAHPLEAVECAVAAAIQEDRFFPKPAELLARITGPAPTPDAVAELAWTTVLQATRSSASWWDSVRFDPPVMAAVVACWGTWPACCEALDHGADAPALLAQRKAFLATVRAYFGRPPSSRPAYLVGQTERTNRATWASWTHGWTTLAAQSIVYFPLGGPAALEPHPEPLALPAVASPTEGTERGDPGPRLRELEATLATKKTAAAVAVAAAAEMGSAR